MRHCPPPGSQAMFPCHVSVPCPMRLASACPPGNACPHSCTHPSSSRLCHDASSRSLTLGASARGCCTSWRLHRPSCWRQALPWCPLLPASSASPSRCGWAACWAGTAARPTAGAGGPTTRGWSWASAGGAEGLGGRGRAGAQEGHRKRTSGQLGWQGWAAEQSRAAPHCFFCQSPTLVDEPVRRRPQWHQ